MWFRLILAIITCLCIGCSGSVLSGGDLRGASNRCLSETDAWLAEPKSSKKLKSALEAVTAAKKSFEKDEKAKSQVLYADLDLLFGALSMAQTGAEYEQDPTKPSGMSDVPVVVSVSMVAGQLRDHLAQAASPTPEARK